MTLQGIGFRSFVLSITLLAAAFLIIGLVLNNAALNTFESSADQWAYGLNDVLIQISRFADRACSNIPWFIIIAILLIRKHSRRLGLFMLIMLVTELALVEVLMKYAVNRPRPWDIIDVVKYIYPNGGSFPSGHCAQMFLFAGFMFIRWRRLSFAVMSVGIFTAFTRLVLCAHYPTDLLCGSLFGFALGAIFYYYTEHLIFPEEPVN